MSEQQTTLVEEEQFEDTMHGKYLVFHLDSQQFAIAIVNVIDIINLQPITRVPNCPDYISGITNLRGKVIPIIDLRIRFGKKPREADENNRVCIIVLEHSGMQVGIVVDSVSEFAALDDSSISPPPPFHTSSESKFIEGVARVNDSIYLLLNCVEVLGPEYLPLISED